MPVNSACVHSQTCLRLLDACHLIGMHDAVASDRNVLASDEALLTEMKSDLVVALALRVVEVPLSARLTPKAPDARLFATTEVPHTAGGLVCLPHASVEATVLVERN